MRVCCQTCKHRVDVETVADVWVSLTEMRCRKFVSTTFDKVQGETSSPQPCTLAIDTCNLIEWRPRTFWQRLFNL